MLHAGFGQGYGFLLFVLFVIGFDQVRNNLVDADVFFGGILGGAGNNQRRAGFINQNGVNLIDDGIVEIALHHFLAGKLHIVAQVVKPQLIVRTVDNVGIVGGTALVIVLAMDNVVDGQAEKAVNLPHPFGIAFGQIIVDGHDVHALAFNRIQIGGQRRNQRFSLAGLHFGNHTLVQHNTADKLDVIMALSQRSFGSLADDGESLGQNIVKRFALFQAPAKLVGFAFEFVIV